jgi:hypothetical protein
MPARRTLIALYLVGISFVAVPLAPASAQEAFLTAQGAYRDTAELALVRSVYVSVGNGINAGCLPDPNALLVEARLILRGFNITVHESASAEPGEYALAIAVLGRQEQPSGACAWYLEVEMYRNAKMPEGHLASVEAYHTGQLATDNSMSGDEDLLIAAVSKDVTELANEILKARGK